MAVALSDLLGSYPEDCAEARLCRMVLRTVPSTVSLPPWKTLRELAERRDLASDSPVLARAEATFLDPRYQRALQRAGSLDVGGALGAQESLQDALALFAAGEVDEGVLRPRAEDTVRRMYGLAAVFDALRPDQSAAMVLSQLPSAKATLALFATLEVGLPLAARAREARGELLEALVSEHATVGEGALAALAATEASEEDAETEGRGGQRAGDPFQRLKAIEKVVGGLAAQLDVETGLLVDHLSPIAEVVEGELGQAEVDDVYRYLVGRLVVEAAFAEAEEELGMDATASTQMVSAAHVAEEVPPPPPLDDDAPTDVAGDEPPAPPPEPPAPPAMPPPSPDAEPPEPAQNELPPPPPPAAERADPPAAERADPPKPDVEPESSPPTAPDPPESSDTLLVAGIVLGLLALCALAAAALVVIAAAGVVLLQ